MMMSERLQEQAPVLPPSAHLPWSLWHAPAAGSVPELACADVLMSSLDLPIAAGKRGKGFY